MRDRAARAVAAIAIAVVALAALPHATAAGAAGPAMARGSELLAAGEYAAARAAFVEALETDPSSVEAHLGLARAYYGLGEYSRAVIEFEKVLSFDNLPRDLLEQAAIYEQAAEDYAAGQKWRAFYYAETGVGNYRENSSTATDIFGGAGNHDTFWPLRVGGGWNTDLTERHAFNATLDYRFRWYDDKDRRNDSDLRWNFNLSRPVDDDSLRFGTRGRVSYRGDGQYRNDWGVFGSYDLGFGPNDRVTIGGEVRERLAGEQRAAVHRREHEGRQGVPAALDLERPREADDPRERERDPEDAGDELRRADAADGREVEGEVEDDEDDQGEERHRGEPLEGSPLDPEVLGGDREGSAQEARPRVGVARPHAGAPGGAGLAARRKWSLSRASRSVSSERPAATIRPRARIAKRSESSSPSARL